MKCSISNASFSVMKLWINDSNNINIDGKLFAVFLLSDKLQNFLLLILHFLWWICASTIHTLLIQPVSLLQSLLLMDNLWKVSCLTLHFWWYCEPTIHTSSIQRVSLFSVCCYLLVNCFISHASSSCWYYCESTIHTSSIQAVSLLQCLLLITCELFQVSCFIFFHDIVNQQFTHHQYSQ